MTPSVSVVIPVLDGERYLGEQLAAIAAQGEEIEVLVIDSGSRDRSVEIARAAGARVIEIPREQFAHGPTRNLGAEQTSGELICFLTQDATPEPGWVDAYREAFTLDERVGAAYGPHLARPDTSPMIARELEEFFAGFSPDGGPVVQRAGDHAYLSNVNACYRRDAWEQIRFRDLPYAEDQAFGRDLLDAGWAKVYHPGAAVLHAHDYGVVDFMRRYYDEYQGLRASVGHVEPFGLRSSVRDVRALVAADRRWMRAKGYDRRALARWTARATVHHAGRKAFSALGSRAERLPAAARRRLSLEGRADLPEPPAPTTASEPGLARPSTFVQGPMRETTPYSSVARYLRDGAAPLLDPVPGMSSRERLHVAVIIPPFHLGSGGHSSIFQIVKHLEEFGHTCSLWVADEAASHEFEWPGYVRRTIVDHFMPLQAPVFKDFGQWYGADVALATGWQTVYPALLLDHCRARAYLVQDHEPEFYATSVEERWSRQTYALGLHHIVASPWLGEVLADRYGVPSSGFDFGVDLETYRPLPVERRRDTIVFYARASTPRRAVALGQLALEELRRRRPELRIAMYGEGQPIPTSFAYDFVGIATPAELAVLYNEATVGLVLSMTNYSLVLQEMLACGLPCVDLAGFSAESVFGSDGPVELAAFDPGDLADRVERLLDDRERWERDSAAGIEFVQGRTWERAARQVEAGLRDALRAREAVSAGTAVPAGTQGGA